MLRITTSCCWKGFSGSIQRLREPIVPPGATCWGSQAPLATPLGKYRYARRRGAADSVSAVSADSVWGLITSSNGSAMAAPVPWSMLRREMAKRCVMKRAGLVAVAGCGKGNCG